MRALATILTVPLLAVPLAAQPAIIPAPAAAQPTDRDQYPDLCGNERYTDCTRVVADEKANTYVRVYRNRNQGGMSVVLYPGLSTQEVAGMTDWGSLRVPRGTKVVKFRYIYFHQDGSIDRVVDFRWLPSWKRGGNKGKRNLPDGRKVDVYAKAWK